MSDQISRESSHHICERHLNALVRIGTRCSRVDIRSNSPSRRVLQRVGLRGRLRSERSRGAAAALLVVDARPNTGSEICRPTYGATRSSSANNCDGNAAAFFPTRITTKPSWRFELAYLWGGGVQSHTLVSCAMHRRGVVKRSVHLDESACNLAHLPILRGSCNH